MKRGQGAGEDKDAIRKKKKKIKGKRKRKKEKNSVVLSIAIRSEQQNPLSFCTESAARDVIRIGQGREPVA